MSSSIQWVSASGPEDKLWSPHTVFVLGLNGLKSFTSNLVLNPSILFNLCWVFELWVFKLLKNHFFFLASWVCRYKILVGFGVKSCFLIFGSLIWYWFHARISQFDLCLPGVLWNYNDLACVWILYFGNAL